MSKWTFDDPVKEFEYLVRQRALFPKEIENAAWVAKLYEGDMVNTIPVYDHRMEGGLVRDCHILRVINRIIEFDHNLSCTITEFALYLRTKNPIGK